MMLSVAVKVGDVARYESLVAKEAGSLAVHWGVNGGWTVTHQVTGLAICTGLCCKSSALLLANELQKYSWDDWKLSMRQVNNMRLRTVILPVADLADISSLCKNWRCPRHGGVQ